MLTLLPKCEAPTKPDYKSMYDNALARIVTSGMGLNEVKQAVYYGVMAVLHWSEPERTPLLEVEARMNIFSSIHYFVGALTPAQLITVFPIDKVYDGDKWQTKDYFYTMDILRKHGMDNPIEAKAIEILYDYTNRRIRDYVVKYMEHINIIRSMQGEPTITDYLTDELGIQPITLHTDPNTGKQFAVDPNGKLIPIMKNRGRLRIVKGRE